MRKALLFAFVFAACASGTQRPATITQPEILLEPATPIFFGSGTSTAASLNLSIANTATVPLTIVKVRIETSGAADYNLQTYDRSYRDTLGPGQMKVIPIVTQAFAAYAGVRPSEPMSVRVFVYFESAAGNFREISLQQLRPM